MSDEERLENLFKLLPDINKNTEVLKEILSIARKTQLIYTEILLEQKRQNKVLEQLRESNRLVTVK